MTLWIRKYFWTVNLVTIALGALFSAMAVGRIVEANLPTVQAQRRAAPASPTPRIGSDQNRDIGPILARNIFCSTCAPVQAAPDSEEAAGNGSEGGPVRTSLGLKLIATLVSEGDQAWSFAAIEDTAAQTTSMYGIGKTVTDNVVVTDIMERRVLLQNGNRNEYIDMEVGGDSGPSHTPDDDEPVRPPPRRHRRGTLPGMEEVSKGIRQVGDGKYEIQRSALNKVLSNTTLLARSARIVPSVRNGKPNGFKLYAIRPGSVYSLLGMFNGDTVNAVNGHAINTPDKALEIYTKLRTASHVSIAFTRRGKSVTHEYTIR